MAQPRVDLTRIGGDVDGLGGVGLLELDDLVVQRDEDLRLGDIGLVAGRTAARRQLRVQVAHQGIEDVLVDIVEFVPLLFNHLGLLVDLLLDIDLLDPLAEGFVDRDRGGVVRGACGGRGFGDSGRVLVRAEVVTGDAGASSHDHDEAGDQSAEQGIAMLSRTCTTRKKQLLRMKQSPFRSAWEAARLKGGTESGSSHIKDLSASAATGLLRSGMEHHMKLKTPTADYTRQEGVFQPIE